MFTPHCLYYDDSKKNTLPSTYLSMTSPLPSGPVIRLPRLVPATEYSTVTPASALLFTAVLEQMLMVSSGMVVGVVVVVVVVVVGRLSRIHH